MTTRIPPRSRRPVDEAASGLAPRDVARRFTRGRAGLVSAAWLGLLIGFIIGHYTPDPLWLGVLVVGLLIGATWGALFGFVASALSRDDGRGTPPRAEQAAEPVDRGRTAAARRPR